ncbi:hypothetical protein PH5382_00013 [Phaeobacter sp. CECT 5382]|uniref:hypothetical protein n=1 Tax=Rhodobacterales TaxID=204455 RepID=UPI0006DA17DB|nr:hypothetical protein [Phaeobacter sp. CECT 5382]CUH86107.1 hypothetical protein PH5382_00013 [Phaeobacter sp. CECT 5382]
MAKTQNQTRPVALLSQGIFQTVQAGFLQSQAGSCHHHHHQTAIALTVISSTNCWADQ